MRSGNRPCLSDVCGTAGGGYHGVDLGCGTVDRKDTPSKVQTKSSLSIPSTSFCETISPSISSNSYILDFLRRGLRLVALDPYSVFTLASLR